MNITIAGIGNAGTTIAADLSNKGHKITLLKTSKSKLHDEHYDVLKHRRTIKVNDLEGNTYIAKIDNVTDNIEDAVRGADVIIIYVQTNFHKALIKQMAPYFSDGQTIIIEPGYLSTCFFLEEVKRDITIIEAESSPIDCRIIKPGEVDILFKNVLNPFGVYPLSHLDKAETILKSLSYPFTFTRNVIEAALHNPNLIVHTIGAIFSIPRIEYTNGNYWMYKEVFTPHIWNIVEALDKEKMDVLEKLNCERISYVEACKLRNSNDKKSDALKVFKDYALNSSPMGPKEPNSRYITEDVPQGLVMLESLGRVLNVATPTTTGLINCASAAMNIDFRDNGRTVESLGKNNIQLILKDN